MKIFPKYLLALLIMTATPFALRAQFNLTGTVTDAGNNPLSGASVKLKNSNDVGVTTNAAGKFSLNIPVKNGVVEISYVGYATQSFSVDANTKSLDVKLVEDIGNLNEVVVTGLATTVKRSNLANAVSSVTAQELVGTTTQATLDGALYGKFTGANISSNSGAPGSGISIKLRGVTSIIGNSQPLFIVDGVYYDNSSIDNGLNAVSKAAAQGSSVLQNNPSNRLADLNPDDIERVEILKGASTAAIYGAKAAGGVVIITTKKGKSGKTIVEFSQSTGIQMQLRKLGGRTWDTAKVRKAYGAPGLALYNAVGGKTFNYEDEL
ncbi:MAG TPA: carboxypeptidase-like regulatory domain-containing protein, partial [Hanamia sp.]|nr:carboxypeptidase-like regulatory domain-containing protein [Hanamia sp.]